LKHVFKLNFWKFVFNYLILIKGGSLIQKLHRQRKRAKRLKRRERRRSTRMDRRKMLELKRQREAATLCKGGILTSGPSGVKRKDFEPLKKYVNRMIRCQGNSKRSTELLKESSMYEVYEKKNPLFHLTLDVYVNKVDNNNGEDGENTSTKPILSFNPPLPDYENSIINLILDFIKSINGWGCVNIDMLMPFEGHKSRDHRGHFKSQPQVTINSEKDLKVLESMNRVRVAMRKSNSVCMALVLYLQKYKEYFYFDQNAFLDNLKQSKLMSSKKNSKHGREKSDGEEDDEVEQGGGGEERATGHGEMEQFLLNLESDFERIDRCKK
jgi:hypothetical protein